MFYSKATGGFYTHEIHGAGIPADVVEITPAEHSDLMAGQAVGKRIVADEDGRPVLVDPLPLPPPVPRQVTRAQGRQALFNANLWVPLMSYVDALTDPVAAFSADNALNHTTEWRRDSQFLATAASTLGLTNQDLDELFTAAAKIAL